MTILFNTLRCDERPEAGSCAVVALCRDALHVAITPRFESGIALLQCRVGPEPRLRPRTGAGRRRRVKAPVDGKYADPSRHPFP